MSVQARGLRALSLIGAILALASAASAAPLLIEDGTRSVQLDTASLLARPDRAEVAIPQDHAYGMPSRYQAVPLADLLAGFPMQDPDGTLEAAATDGFAAQIPLAALRGTGPDGARGWLAIEPEAGAWPALPGKTVGAGPFYIVWERPAASGITPEYWAYQVAALRYVPSPERRWPQIAVDAALPADHPARTGQRAYATICIACHRMNGGGSAEMGPDLNQPMSPVEYFQGPALRRFIRDPGSVRTWPDRKMQGIAPEQLSETQLDGLVAYLEHMASRRSPR